MADSSDLPGFLERLLSLPTAPFHERFVSSFLRAELEKAGLDFYQDDFGNIVASSGQGDGVVAFVAHMDHPGFEILESTGRSAEAAWFGGVDAKYFIGTPVVVYERESGRVSARGRVKRITKNAQGRVERMALGLSGRARPGDFGTWDLVPYRRRASLIHTKGADDLVGCAALFFLLRALKAKKVPTAVRAVFTRAEEQGFIGTLGMIRAGTLPQDAKVVSVETSKALPGIAFGSGPVIRLGDRTSMFHHEMVLFLDRVAQALRRRNPRFAYQRRVMDGGTCEATPYQLGGYVAGGIAIPLGNYHNQGKEKIRAEIVHLKDIEGAVHFMLEMVQRMDEFHVARGEIQRRWEGLWEQYGGRLAAAGGKG